MHKRTAKEFLYGLTAANTKDSGPTTKGMEKELLLCPTDKYTQVNGSTTRKAERVYTLGMTQKS